MVMIIAGNTDSKFCKYDQNCERDLCMFKHTKRKEQDGNVESNDECNEVIDIIDVESEGGEIDEENVNDTSEINVNDNKNKTFHNPSQEDITPHGNSFKCEKCDFEARTKSDLVNHKNANSFADTAKATARFPPQ